MASNKKWWVLIPTLLLIFLVFLFYFFVYVKNKEKEIIVNNMRVLTQINKNVQSRLNTFYKIELSNFNQYLSDREQDSVRKSYDQKRYKIKKDQKKKTGWAFKEGEILFAYQKDETDSIFEYKQGIQELFNYPLIHRSDVFDFVTVSSLNDSSGHYIVYTNSPASVSYLPSDSTISKFISKSYFEMVFGFEEYMVFNSTLETNKNIFITGYVNKSKFNDLKREVSVFTITLTTIVIILLLLSLPMLKLRIMSNVERLHMGDVFLTGIAILVGASVLVILLLFFSSNLLYERNNQKDKLEQLSIRVSEGFYQELDDAISRMKTIRDSTSSQINSYYHSMLENPSRASQYVPYFRNLEDYLVNANDKVVTFKNSHNYISNYGYPNGYFWTDSLGKVKFSLSQLKSPPNKGADLNHRKYIMDIVNGKAISYKNDTIAIESIRSIFDGIYEIGIGIPTNKPKLPILAQSSTFVSLFDPIMEQGYGFCIFDKEGKTLFHSDKSRNLNENFLDETQGKFNSYLLSGTDHFESVIYSGARHFVHMSPLKNLDGMFIATFVNKQNVRSPNVIAMNVTIVMQFVFYIFLILVFLVLYLSTAKRSKLRQRVFAFNWLRPYLSPDGKYQKLYTKLLIYNLFSALILIWVGMQLNSAEAKIFALLFICTWLIMIQFYLLSLNMPFQKKVYTLFSNSSAPKIFLLFCCGSLLLGTWVFIQYYFDTNQWFVSSWFVLFIGLSIYWFYPLMKEILNKTSSESEGHVNSFSVSEKIRTYKYYIFSWVILLSIIPTFIFFSINFEKEKAIMLKSNCHHMNSQYQQWQSKKSENFYELKGTRSLKVDSIDFFINQMNLVQVDLKGKVEGTNHISGKALSEADLKPTMKDVTPVGYFNFELIKPNVEQRDQLLNQYYGHIRFYFNDYGERSQGYINDQNFDSGWMYKNGTMHFANVGRSITSYEQLLSNILGDYKLFHFLSILILMLFTFKMTEYALHRIFGLDFKNYVDHLVGKRNLEGIVSDIREIITFTKSTDTNEKDKKEVSKYDLTSSFNNCLITGVNASHLFRVREKLKADDEFHFVTIDFFDLKNEDLDYLSAESKDSHNTLSNRQNNIILNIANMSEPGKRDVMINALSGRIAEGQKPILVYIEHFEYAYNDMAYNKKKMIVLERLVDNPCIRVVISSEVDPKKVYNFYQSKIERLKLNLAKKEGDAMEIEKSLKDIEIDYRKWMHLMGGFYKIIAPLELVSAPIEKGKSDVIEAELNNGVYLNQLIPWYNRNYEQNVSDEDYTLNIQELSSSYYFSIWGSLSTEERLIVYDIAKDKFVNTNNVDGIIDLLHKGILKFDHSLRLMNESFTNFILSEVHSNEALEREMESRKKGRWSTASAVFILIIVSLVIFVSFGKVSALDDVNALVSSLGAVMALFLRVSGIVTLGSAK